MDKDNTIDKDTLSDTTKTSKKSWQTPDFTEISITDDTTSAAGSIDDGLGNFRT